MGNTYNNGKGGNWNNKPETPKPNDYQKILSFYDGENVKSELFNETAQEIAKCFLAVEGKKAVCVSPTQMRKIFDEVKRYETILSSSGENSSWEKQLPYIKMINAKTSYLIARQKKTEEIPCYKNLGAFISNGIELIKTEEDYHIFVALFEAVYGFYYGICPNRNS